MRYFVVLENSGGGELARREIGTKGSDEPNVSEAVADFALSVVIYPGDIIRVVEQED